MYEIVVPGKVSGMSVFCASAKEALAKYRKMETDGLLNVAMRDAKGETVDASELERRALAETEA